MFTPKQQIFENHFHLILTFYQKESVSEGV